MEKRTVVFFVFVLIFLGVLYYSFLWVFGSSSSLGEIFFGKKNSENLAVGTNQEQDNLDNLGSNDNSQGSLGGDSSGDFREDDLNQEEGGSNSYSNDGSGDSTSNAGGGSSNDGSGDSTSNAGGGSSNDGGSSGQQGGNSNGGSASGTVFNLQASDGDFSDKVVLTWEGSGDVLSYKIYRSTSSKSCEDFFSGTTSTSFEDTIANPGVTYYYSIKGVLSDFSETECSNVDSGYALESSGDGDNSNGDNTNGGDSGDNSNGDSNTGFCGDGTCSSSESCSSCSSDCGTCQSSQLLWDYTYDGFYARSIEFGNFGNNLIAFSNIVFQGTDYAFLFESNNGNLEWIKQYSFKTNAYSSNIFSSDFSKESNVFVPVIEERQNGSSASFIFERYKIPGGDYLWNLIRNDYPGYTYMDSLSYDGSVGVISKVRFSGESVVFNPNTLQVLKTFEFSPFPVDFFKLSGDGTTVLGVGYLSASVYDITKNPVEQKIQRTIGLDGGYYLLDGLYTTEKSCADISYDGSVSAIGLFNNGKRNLGLFLRDENGNYDYKIFEVYSPDSGGAVCAGLEISKDGNVVSLAVKEDDKIRIFSLKTTDGWQTYEKTMEHIIFNSDNRFYPVDLEMDERGDKFIVGFNSENIGDVNAILYRTSQNEPLDEFNFNDVGRTYEVEMTEDGSKIAISSCRTLGEWCGSMKISVYSV